MVDVRPFKAITYSKNAGSIVNLVSQPYDKIDSSMQRNCYEKSVYNYCRLILPSEENKYEVVKNRLNEWIDNKILVKDKKPGLFIYRQEFYLEEKKYARIGLIAALRLYSYNEKEVFPHEVTYNEPKADRIKMLESVQKNLEPVFLIYSDPEKIILNFFSNITNNSPLIDFKDSSGITHTIWKIFDLRSINFIRDALKEKNLVIADGHHRYESAIIYRDTMRQKEEWTKDSAYNFHMSFIVPVEEDGLVLMPTHRALKEFELTPQTINKLRKFFSLQIIDPTVESIESFLNSNSKNHAFCVYNGAKVYGLVLKNETLASMIINDINSNEVDLLDVIILRDLVFKHIMGIGDLKIHEDILYVDLIGNVLEKVDRGEAKLAFLVNPIDAKTVWRISQKGQRLPGKSTDFYPKPCSGLLMMDISNTEKL